MASWNSARHRARQLTALSSLERRTLLQAAALLPLATLGRRVRSYRQIRSMLIALLPPRLDAPAGEPSHAERIAQMVQIAAGRSLLRPSCLDRSLVLWALLRRNGNDADLRIGVRKNGENFEAHAWVELDGRVLNDADSVGQHYAAFSAPLPEQTVWTEGAHD